MKKIIGILFLILISCLFYKCKCLEQNQESFILKTKIEYVDGIEAEESVKYFYLKSIKRKELENFARSNNTSINTTIRLLLEKFNGIPIFDYPVKYWDPSCRKGKLSDSKDSNSPNDTIAYHKVLDELKEDATFYKIPNSKYQGYKINIYYKKVAQIEYCKIESEFSYSDSCIIVKKMDW